MSRASLSLLPLFILLFAAPAFAERDPKAPYTDPAEADWDFHVQGEYAGWLAGPGGREHVGLQVIGLGDTAFDAVLYRGGLPGNGWDGVTKEKLSGNYKDGGLVLLGDSRSLVVANRRATVYDHGGQQLGALVRIARRSPTLGLAPPPQATVLFDGSSTDQLVGAKVTPDGLLQAGVLTKQPVDAFRLHLEFRAPYMPYARGQGRANSGVYIQQRYEVQILDSFGLEGLENECGGLYRQTRPALNLCLPPLSWQTYDIWFTPPAFDGEGRKTANARLTVLHNGFPIHQDREVTAKTGGGKQEGPEPFPINLQDHGNPVVFRNIWIVDQRPSAQPSVAPPSVAQPSITQPFEPGNFFFTPGASGCPNGNCTQSPRRGMFYRRGR